MVFFVALQPKNAFIASTAHLSLYSCGWRIRADNKKMLEQKKLFEEKKNFISFAL